MKKEMVLLIPILLLINVKLRAQELYHLINSDIIREVREDPTNPAPSSFDIIGYEPDFQFKFAWESTLNRVKTSENSELLDSLILRQADIQTIYSTRVEGKNLIFYDEDFFNQFRGIDYLDVDYLIKFSFLHEIGHFLNGDVQGKIQTKEAEAKADMYACESLCLMMEASSEKVQSVILSLDGATSSKFYYSKGIRLKTIQRFFDEGKCSVSPAVHFEFDSSVIKAKSYPLLDSLSSILRESGKKVKVVGYYFSGDPEYDLATSKDHANSVKSYLINSGVKSTQIETQGRGQSSPIASNSTEEGRSLNRRVEFLLD